MKVQTIDARGMRLTLVKNGRTEDDRMYLLYTTEQGAPVIKIDGRSYTVTIEDVVDAALEHHDFELLAEAEGEE